MRRHSWDLTDGWTLRDTGPRSRLDGWVSATVPGVVHQDLIRHGLIPDPYYAKQEPEVQWVGEQDWEYATEFDIPTAAIADHLDLCLDGLDTLAEVWLDDELVGTSANMFLPTRIDMSAVDRSQRHRLRLVFASALREGHQRQRTHGMFRHAHADDGRVHIRKAQCHWGWDWGPTIMTAGPWRAVRVESYRRRISDVHVEAGLEPDHQSAPIRVTVRTDGIAVAGETVRLEFVDPDGLTVQVHEMPIDDGQAAFAWILPEPRLWWPRGSGDQPMYVVRVTVLDGVGDELDVSERRFGVRTIELVQEPVAGEEGTSFRFDVNGVRIFCAGVNWIPADQMLPRITPEQYRTLLELTADSNSTMIRVWGGGIYEPDLFYDLCDELGLLVWQDFMFACGIYPAYDEFVASVRAEAEHHVRRLRHHPSLALWCGNNEDYQVAEGYGVYGPTDTSDTPITEEFPAREIYEHMLPAICEALHPGSIYWPGSPYLGYGTFDPTVGDQHHWLPVPETPTPYPDYWQHGGRFISEFGMLAMPDIQTIEESTPAEERHLTSPVLRHRDKSFVGGWKRSERFLAGNLGIPEDLADYTYASHLNQAECLGGAIAAWRRRFRGPGADACSGVLVWQINDCWPAISWSIVDYNLRPKGGYWAVKRELAPFVVGLEDVDGGTAVWAVNGTMSARSAELVISRWLLDGQEIDQERRWVELEANRARELGSVELRIDRDHVIGAELVVDGKVVASRLLIAAPYSQAEFSEPALVSKRVEPGLMSLESDVPLKGLWLSSPGATWSQNIVDLLPSRPVMINVSGISEESAVTARWLGPHGKPMLSELFIT